MDINTLLIIGLLLVLLFVARMISHNLKPIKDKSDILIFYGTLWVFYVDHPEERVKEGYIFKYDRRTLDWFIKKYDEWEKGNSLDFMELDLRWKSGQQLKLNLSSY